MILGAQAMVNCLINEKITTVFGYPGAAIAPFYDALGRSDIRHILTRSEQGAGHAASGYARVTGRPGVCISTSGPGATNLFTAIATAYSDSIPLIAITGQVATFQLGRDVFQEVDTTGAAHPFTKHSYLVKNAADLPRVFKEAFHIACTGRRGPVIIDVPVDVQAQKLTAAFSYPEQVSIRGYKPVYKGHPLQISKAAKAIGLAQKPVLCCGGGVLASGAGKDVREFCEKTGIPAVSTMMGIGAMPPSHPLYFGMIGQSGVLAANTAVRESDLIILVGARVGNRAISQPAVLESSATIVHIDIDTAEIGKNLDTTIPIVGDAGVVIGQIMEKAEWYSPNGWSSWASRLEELRGGEGQFDIHSYSLEPNSFIKALCGMIPHDSIYVADVGQNQTWSARGYSLDGTFLTTGGMGTMGYAIPAAIGAKLAAPDKTVVAVCGDGAFEMSFGELATIVGHGSAVKVVVLRNGKLGMVRELQLAAYGRETAVDLTGSPDLELLAKAYGLPYRRVESMEDITALEPLLAEEGPCLIECAVNEEICL